MGIAELLTLIFAIMKIGEIGKPARWSWWKVFMPIFIVYGMFAAIALYTIVVVNI